MSQAKKALPSRASFIQALTAWMLNKDMQLGHVPEAVDSKNTIRLFKIASIVFTSLSSMTPILISGGAKAEKARLALEPYTRLSDVVGLHLSLGLDTEGQYMILGMVGDDLSAKDLVERFELFMELAPAVTNLGMKVNFRSGGLLIHPLIFYFNPLEYRKKASQVLASGWREKFWKNIGLRAAAIELVDEKIEWAETQGKNRFWEKLGVNLKKFQAKDLDLILRLAEKLDDTKHDIHAPGDEYG